MTPPTVVLLAGRLRRATESAAGYDLFAAVEEPFSIPAGERRVVPTGVRTAITPPLAGLILDRSGLAAKAGVTVLGGLIDADYRGEWQVVLLNTGRHPVTIGPGQRVAQAVFVPLSHAVVAVDEAEVSTGRAARDGGFGSTGR